MIVRPPYETNRNAFDPFFTLSISDMHIIHMDIINSSRDHCSNTAIVRATNSLKYDKKISLCIQIIRITILLILFQQIFKIVSDFAQIIKIFYLMINYPYIYI